MNPSFFELSIAIAMVAISAALIIWIRGYLAVSSHGRMMRMFKRAGLDPEIAASGDNEAIMKEVRRRCRRCPSEDYCERWLAGAENDDNAFCPNAPVFEFLQRAPAGMAIQGQPAIK